VFSGMLGVDVARPTPHAGLLRRPPPFRPENRFRWASRRLRTRRAKAPRRRKPTDGQG
jgi:hypothetical protein